MIRVIKARTNAKARSPEVWREVGVRVEAGESWRRRREGVHSRELYNS